MEQPTPSTTEETRQQPEARLENKVTEPLGVFRRNLKMQLYLGVAVLFIIATAISSMHHKPVTNKQAQQGPPQPMVQPPNDASIEEMKQNLQKQEQQAAHPQTVAVPSYPGGAPVAYDAGAALGMTGQPGSGPYGANGMPPNPAGVPGQSPAGTYGYNQQPQLTPQQQQQLQLQEQERELAFKARFASNLAYSQSHGISGQSNLVPANQPTGVPSSFLQPSTPAGQTPAAAPQQPGQFKRSPAVNINAATGQPYVVYEGTLIDTVLMNRLDGDAVGPVKVLVTNPVYSHDMQHVLVPEGTVVLGEARKIGNAGFGQQRRIAVVFHRMIMPDGYSVDLDQFQGLNQTGETGLKDKVNNHYLQIFGTSIALGIIAGAAEISSGNGSVYPSGQDAFQYGAAASVSQSATTVLDQFINIPPTITIREGHRVKVYISQDLLLPAYDNHTIPSTF